MSGNTIDNDFEYVSESDIQDNVILEVTIDPDQQCPFAGTKCKCGCGHNYSGQCTKAQPCADCEKYKQAVRM